MMLFGAGLYLIFLVLILWFVKCARGKSLGDLFEENDHHHHEVLRVIEKYPRGGTWSQHRTWMEEDVNDK